MRRLTGREPYLPAIKARQFRFERNKFGAAGLTPIASEVVRPVRAGVLPYKWRPGFIGAFDECEKLGELGGGIAAEVEILRVHASEEFIQGENYIDPAKVVAAYLQLSPLLPACEDRAWQDIS